ncbi:MAG: ABC-F family ATP-binding cassette domain-containing protein [Pseudomonadota bacterium]
MAEPPLLTLSGITLGFGGRPLFEGVELALGPGERLAVVGRNGSGKSTLLKVMAGLTEPDAGQRFVRPGTTVSYLPQDPDLSGHASLGDYAAAELEPAERWRAEAAMDGLKVAAEQTPGAASGGERRRAALARLIAGEPDLMLLDEPTNHLDIQAIEWLEGWLGSTRAAFALISHDRTFLERLTRGTLWIDRGEVRRSPVGFGGFEAWREKVWEEEDAARHKLDRLIKEEARWAVEGISARRTRNQGRLRRLAALREERAAQIRRKGPAAMALETEGQTGKRVIEARGISKRFGERVMLKPFDLRVSRGECIAIVGPNGAGKTTLVNLLTGAMAPDEGSVKLGTGVEMAVFDQQRAQLDPAKSLWATVTGADEAGGSDDRISVRGQARHPVAYLKEFLFDERQARGPVAALSGGEKARLLLAVIMMRPANLLALDEPTNDLDIETLDLLQELIADFDGTTILVSHDRDFIDRVATTTIAMEGDGRAVVYAGGWSDYRAQAGRSFADLATGTKPGRAEKKAAPKQAMDVQSPSRGARQKLSFKQEHRLKQLPAEIDRLTAEIAKLEDLLADPDLFTREPVKFQKATIMLEERRIRLDAAEEEWLELEELRESLAG